MMLCPPGCNFRARSSARARFCSSSSDHEADEWYRSPTPSPTGLRRSLRFGGEAVPTSIGVPAPWVSGWSPAPTRRPAHEPLGVRPGSRQIEYW